MAAALLLLVLGGCREPNQNPLQSPAVAPQAAGPGGEGKAAMGGQSAPDAGAIVVTEPVGANGTDSTLLTGVPA